MKTEHRNRLIISGLITVVLFYFVVWPVYNFFKYSYDVEFDDIEEYKFLFRNPSDLKPLFAGIGRIRATDQIYTYNTKDGLSIDIHEFYAINEYSMDRVEYDFINKFPDYNDWDGRQLNSDLTEAPIISLKDHLPFNNTLYVDYNLNTQALIHLYLLSLHSFY